MNYERLKHLSLCLDNIEMFPFPSVRNLGADFNHSMKMDDHVNQLSRIRTLNFHIRNLNRIRRFLDFEACHNAVRALILSKLDCCSCLLNGLTQKISVASKRSRTESFSRNLKYLMLLLCSMTSTDSLFLIVSNFAPLFMSSSVSIISHLFISLLFYPLRNHPLIFSVHPEAFWFNISRSRTLAQW